MFQYSIFQLSQSTDTGASGAHLSPLPERWAPLIAHSDPWPGFLSTILAKAL